MRRLAILAVLLAPAAAAQEDDGVALLVEALGATEEPEVQLEMLRAISGELAGRGVRPMPPGWAEVSARLASSPEAEVRFETLVLSVRFGDAAAGDSLRTVASDPSAPIETRRRALEAVSGADAAPFLHDLLADPELRRDAIAALAGLDHPGTPAALLAAIPTLDEASREDALAALASRPAWAAALLAEVEAGRVEARSIGAGHVRRLRQLEDPEIARRVVAAWGLARETREDRKAAIERFRVLMEAAGDPPDPWRGRAVFAKTCMRCHTLFGQGARLGPELTGSNRADLGYLLENLVDPNAVIGADYLVRDVLTTDRRVVSGLLRADEPRGVTIENEHGKVFVPREKVARFRTSEVSMMPENQLDELPGRDVRDLFAYLRGPTQVPELATAESATRLFDGKTLAGWTGREGLWRVEDGQIVGQTTGLDRNEFLVSDLAAGDLRLTLDVLLVGDRGNSGIQFRSEALEAGEVKGYQADVGPGWWGALYEEHGRGLLVKAPAGPALAPGEWTTYEVLAVGSRIRTVLGGRLAVDLDDPAGARRGVFALQLHSGGATEIRFRNLVLEVDPAPELRTVK